MKFYKEKTSNRDFSKKARQNFLIFAYVVGNYLNFWNLGVPIAVTFLNLGDPSQTVCPGMAQWKVAFSCKRSQEKVILVIFSSIIPMCWVTFGRATLTSIDREKSSLP